MQCNRGMALREKGDLTAAIDHYRQALKIDRNCWMPNDSIEEVLKRFRARGSGCAHSLRAFQTSRSGTNRSY